MCAITPGKRGSGFINNASMATGAPAEAQPSMIGVEQEKVEW